MFRLIGIATGAALTIGTMALLLGVPRIDSTSERANAAPVAAPVRAPETGARAATEPAPERPVAAAEPAPPTAPAEPRWHSFWNPFRSEIAASGFAARLTAVTGIDYRVVRVDPGSYQVAFAYVDDRERAAKIARIESATGLRLPEDPQ